MKKALFWLFLVGFGPIAVGQIDTIVIRDTLEPAPYVDGAKYRFVSAKPEYFARRHKSALLVGKEESVALHDHLYEWPAHKPYYLRFYWRDQLLLEGVFFEGLNYGELKEYKNGKLILKGDYTSDYTFKKNGTVKSYPERKGKWEFFNSKGRVYKTEYYRDGKRIR